MSGWCRFAGRLAKMQAELVRDPTVGSMTVALAWVRTVIGLILAVVAPSKHTYGHNLHCETYAGG